jgi:hypothetical protein
MVTPAVDSTMFAIVNDAALVSFPRNAPGTVSPAVSITGLQAGDTVFGADFRPANDTLYVMGRSGNLYTLDTDTGVATLVGNLTADPADTSAPFTALTGTNCAVDVNPVADRLRVECDSGQNLRINMANAMTTTDGNLNFPSPDVAAAGYTRSFAGTTRTMLYVIDVATNTLQLQSPPNDGTLVTVGRLDPVQTFTDSATLDIAGGDNGLVFGALQPTGATQSTLYRVNLSTGAVTSLGNIGPVGEGALRGFTIQLK